MTQGSKIKFDRLSEVVEFILEGEGKMTSQFEIEYVESSWVLTFTGAC